MKKIYNFIFLLSVIVILVCKMSYAREFKIIANPQEPFKFKENGKMKGIDVEILDIIMKRLRVNYKLRLIKSDSRIQEEARTGRADMLILFSKKKSRMEYLIYPKESYIDLKWNFFIRIEDKGKFKFNSLKDLKGYKIGATKDISYTPEFWNAGLNLDIVTTNFLQVRKLIGKRFDLVPLNTLSTLYEEKKRGNLHKLSYLPKPLKSKPYYNVFTKASNYPEKQKLIKKYDKIVRKMKVDGSIKRLFNKYFGK